MNYIFVFNDTLAEKQATDHDAMNSLRYKNTNQTLRWVTLGTSAFTILLIFIRQCYKNKWFEIFTK